MVARPGRKKYAPPLTVMKLGMWSVRCRTDGGLNREAARFVARCADESVLFAAEPAEDAVVDPVLLNELELPFDVAVQADEEHSPLVAVLPARLLAEAACRRGGLAAAAGADWPSLSAAAGSAASESRGLARRMCEPTGQAKPCGSLANVNSLLRALSESVAMSGMPSRCRPTSRAANSSASCGEVEAPATARDEIPEFLHVLFELTKDQVGAVAAKLTKVCSVAGA